MITRRIAPRLVESLDQFPVVALLGSRQVGKSTLARVIATERESVFLDLERPADVAKLRDAEMFLNSVTDKLVIIDEVQRSPELFPQLRVLVDSDRRPGRFLLLGSAAPDLRRQSAESLAGRIEYHELTPFTLDEIGATPENQQRLWLRGGYPGSYLASSDLASARWREAYIRTFLERDIPQLGMRLPAEHLRRFWTMLAHLHGQLWNSSQLARNLSISPPTARHYLDVLSDTFMVRILPPHHANLGKRLVKSPKVYLRDSGLLHSLLGISRLEDLLAHPAVGASWEGFVVEHLIGHARERSRASFYRTSTGAELDLLIERGSQIDAWEVKFGLAPRITRGYHEALRDLDLPSGNVVYSGTDGYAMASDARATGLAEAIADFESLSPKAPTQAAR
jgi:predicted AAA+ superfamily ATPase